MNSENQNNSNLNNTTNINNENNVVFNSAQQPNLEQMNSTVQVNNVGQVNTNNLSIDNTVSTQQTTLNQNNVTSEVNNIEQVNNVNLSQNMNNLGMNQQTMNNNVDIQQPVQTNVNNSKKPIDKKKIIIICGVLVALVAVFLVYKFFFSGTKIDKSIATKFDEEGLILVEKDSKYGYIDTNGKFVIEPIYEYASSFYGNYAVVKAEIEKDSLKETVYQLIDKKGNVKYTSEYSDFEYIESKDIWIIEDKLFSGDLKQLTPDTVSIDYNEYYGYDDGDDSIYFEYEDSKDNTAGIMDVNGKKIYTYKYKSGESYFTFDIDKGKNDEFYCLVNIENEKYGIVNCKTGKVIYDLTTNYISNDKTSMYEIKNKETYDLVEYIVLNGDKIVYRTQKDESIYHQGKYLEIYDRDTYDDKYIDIKTGKELSEEPEYEDEEEVEEIDEWEEYTKLTKFSCDKGYGIMNSDKVVLPCEYDSISYLDIDLYKYIKSKGKNYILVSKKDKYNLYDLDSKKVITNFNSDDVKLSSKSTFITFVNYNDSKTSYIIYNLVTGKSLKLTHSDYSIHSNYITVDDEDSGKTKYYNTKLELIYTEK